MTVTAEPSIEEVQRVLFVGWRAFVEQMLRELPPEDEKMVDANDPNYVRGFDDGRRQILEAAQRSFVEE